MDPKVESNGVSIVQQKKNIMETTLLSTFGHTTITENVHGPLLTSLKLISIYVIKNYLNTNLAGSAIICVTAALVDRKYDISEAR